MAVKIVSAQEAEGWQANDYVRVSTHNDPDDDTVTLATIQRFVARHRLDDSSDRLHVKTLVLEQPMSSDQALGLATCYAERKNIPVVFKS